MEAKKEPQNFLILNNIRSAENVGALFRICDSSNVNLIIQGYSPHPKVERDTRLPYVINKDTQKITKTATESINNVKFSYFESEQDVINFVKSQNLNLYSLEEGKPNSINIFNNFHVETPFALVVGNEKNGVSDYFLENSKKILCIPMLGTNNSLNVAVCAGIALYKLILG